MLRFVQVASRSPLKLWFAILVGFSFTMCSICMIAIQIGLVSNMQPKPLISPSKFVPLSKQPESNFISILTNNQSQTASSSRVQVNGESLSSALVSERQERKTAQHNSRSWIPFIIHQTYKDLDLPAPYYISLQGLLRHNLFRDPRRHPVTPTFNYTQNNDRNFGPISFRGTLINNTNNSKLPVSNEPEIFPRFDYYFWTDTSISDYVFEHEARKDRPEFGIFKQLKLKLETADAIRYFALYEFGGVYLDLDIEVVLPLAPFLERGYPCVLSEESPMQVGNQRVTNCFMLCRPKHPLMKLLVDSLPEFQHREGGANVRTGPHFLSHYLNKYLNSARMKRPVSVSVSTVVVVNLTLGELCAYEPSAHEDCVYIAPAHFFDSLDMPRLQEFRRKCRSHIARFSKRRPSAGTWDLRVLEHCELYSKAMDATGSKVHLVPPLTQGPSPKLDPSKREQVPQESRRSRAVQSDQSAWPEISRGESQDPSYSVHHYLHMGAYQTDGGLRKAPIYNFLHGFWLYVKAKGMCYVRENEFTQTLQVNFK